ncbi:DNA repair protein Rad60 [Prorops nasuta]|uniref:DNA repair protein Rad60 n=1 Tax=Prorops nasuta TaxID=863751 RepID=UPI0034CE62FE
MDLLSSSSDDDDFYVNSVARLKAFKKDNPIKPVEKKVIETVEDVIIVDNPETSLTDNLSSKNETDENSDCECTEDGYAVRTRAQTKRRVQKKREVSEDKVEDALNSENDLILVESLDCSIDEHINDNDVSIISNDVSITDQLEEEDRTINIKILWRSHNVHRKTLGINESFKTVFEYFAELEKVPVENILLLRNNKPINFKDTPGLLGISVIDIIEGGIVQSKKSAVQEEIEENEEEDENTCKIKIQSNNRESIIVSLRRDQSCKELFVQCAKTLAVPEANIKLYFDGEQISISDTPESLDLDQEACVDLRVSNL